MVIDFVDMALLADYAPKTKPQKLIEFAGVFVLELVAGARKRQKWTERLAQAFR